MSNAESARMATGAATGMPQAHEEEVFLVVDDLSSLNQYLACLGLGIYHTGVCVYGREFMVRLADPCPTPTPHTHTHTHTHTHLFPFKPKPRF